jgi:hypothetical protein
MNMIPPSRVSFGITSDHSGPEHEAATISNPYQTSNGYTSSNRARQLELDLLGLDRQQLEGYNLNEFSQPAVVDSAGFKLADDCPRHGPILAMGNGVGTREQSLSPMARWLGEGHTEQCTLLLLQDGNLSFHKECQCGKLLEAGMGLEIED